MGLKDVFAGLMGYSDADTREDCLQANRHEAMDWMRRVFLPRLAKDTEDLRGSIYARGDGARAFKEGNRDVAVYLGTQRAEKFRDWSETLLIRSTPTQNTAPSPTWVNFHFDRRANSEGAFGPCRAQMMLGPKAESREDRNALITAQIDVLRGFGEKYMSVHFDRFYCLAPGEYLSADRRDEVEPPRDPNYLPLDAVDAETQRIETLLRRIPENDHAGKADLMEQLSANHVVRGACFDMTSGPRLIAYRENLFRKQNGLGPTS